MTMTSPLAAFDRSITIFGCGTMAGAMLHRWLATGLVARHVTAIRQHPGTIAPGMDAVTDAADLPAPDILLIGIKPQQFAALAPEIARLAGPDTLVLSILAGVPLERLQSALPEAGAIVRLMPNLPVAEGRGIVARVGEAVAHGEALDALLAPLGHVQPVADEGEFDLVTALAGCGPAFVYRFVAALSAAGQRLGLDEVAADQLARLTVAGAGETAARATATPAELAAAVASPGGMTQAGLDILDADGRLIALLTDTLRAARDRGRELAQQAAEQAR